MTELGGKQARYLRGLGHHLKPVVMIGKDEVTDSLLEAVEEALEKHELIKVKVQEGCPLDRKDVAKILSKKTRAGVAQVLGKTILLYRESEEKKITLPS